MRKLASFSAVYGSLLAIAVSFTPALAEARRNPPHIPRLSRTPLRHAITAVPELDASLAVLALVLVTACVLVVRGRRGAGSTKP